MSRRFSSSDELLLWPLVMRPLGRVSCEGDQFSLFDRITENTDGGGGGFGAGYGRVYSGDSGRHMKADGRGDGQWGYLFGDGWSAS